MSNHETVSRNEAFRIEELSKLVRTGRIRIPEFQRSFRWDAADVLSLFDSILRGYPFGSFLLWKQPAPQAELAIGALRVEAEERPEALWVVDGQQRITSLVNAIDPSAAEKDERFRIFYSLTRRQVVAARDVGSDLAVPLSDLFDFGRALGWLATNADAAEHATEVQRVTGLLNRVEVSAAVIEQGDERVLRDVFDRINSRGKRLDAAEIFDALHSSGNADGESNLSLPAIASRIDRATDFGTLDRTAVVQALLVRRHPDITRDVHAEFNPNRAAEGAFPGESELEAYERTEEALDSAVRFLQDRVGIPHFTFLPFRFQLLVLVRFFGFFDKPQARNLELLSRWFWRSTVAAAPLGFTGSTRDVRAQANFIRPNDESGSIQRLLKATEISNTLAAPDIHTFRTNHSAGKVILAALWSLEPINPETGAPLSRPELASALDGDASPAAIALELFPQSSGKLSLARNAANRMIAVQSRQDFTTSLTAESNLGSLLLDEDLRRALQNDQREVFLQARAEKLESYLRSFIRDRTGEGFAFTPPLSTLDLDSDDELSPENTR
jgi:hypothetical protein